MSDTEERKALLADGDKDLGADDDQFANMHQMMGFSSFGGPQKPKRQPRGPKPGKGFGTGANSQPVQERLPSSSAKKSTLSATSHPFTPASLPPHPAKQVSTPSSAPVQDDSSFQSLDPVQAMASPHPQLRFTSTLNPASAEFDPESVPRDFSAELTDRPNEIGQSTISLDFDPDSNLDEIAYTNPRTQYKLTKRELAEYERGVVEHVVNNDGSTSQVKVYFKPNFIEDNPWKSLEVTAESKKARTEPQEVSVVW